MDVPTAESGQSGAAVCPWPVQWKEDFTKQLLKLFHSTAAKSCPEADLEPLTPAVTEAIATTLTSIERRYREYAEYCVYHVQSNTELDVQTTSSLLLQTETSIQFYVEERLSVWKKQSQDWVDMPPPDTEGLHLDDANYVHVQALDMCFPRLVRDMRARGTSLVNNLVADDVISDTSADSILNKGTHRQVNEEVLKAVRGLSAQQFQTSFLPALEREAGNALLARELTSTIRRLQDNARSQSQGGCRVCVLRDRVDPRRLADQLLARGLIPRGLYDDLRAKTLSTDEAWERIFLHVGHTEKLIPALSEKYPAVHAEMLEKGISSLECRCRRLSSGLGDLVQARSEGDVTDIARMSDFTSLLQKDKLPLPEYRMTSSKRGYCFLVVNTVYMDKLLDIIFRDVFKNTHAALRDMFRRLGFDLIERQNLSASQLMEEARKVAHMDHSASDCLAVVLLTSDGPRDILRCSDGADVTVEAVKELFVASRCPSLAGKPKLLYRPMGRGLSIQGGVSRTDEEGSTHAAPDHADFLVIETCPPECRTALNGVTKVIHHVELLTAVLERHGHEEDFLSCVSLVNNQMSKTRSKKGGFFTSPIHSTLTKKLKFPLLK